MIKEFNNKELNGEAEEILNEALSNVRDAWDNIPEIDELGEDDTTIYYKYFSRAETQREEGHGIHDVVVGEKDIEWHELITKEKLNNEVERINGLYAKSEQNN